MAEHGVNTKTIFFSFLLFLRIREFRKDLPIIAQSGNAYETDRAESLRAGCNDFITKPIQSEKLLAVLAAEQELLALI